jgi:NitT/TauT family transport system substrate-binding protein
MTGISRRTLVATTGLAAAGLVLPACSGSDGEASGSADGSLDEVTYVTGLGLFGREGGAHVADAKGYFADEHIKVTVRPGQAGDYNLQALRGGQAQFVAIDYSGAVVRAGTGKFEGLRCIGVLQQRTIIALMALASSGIRTPRDLLGRTIGAATGAVPKTLFPAYAKLAGLTEAQVLQVKWIEAQGTQLPTLLATHKVDAIGQFVPAQPTVSAAAKGVPVNVLPYSDYMSDLYGNVVVTRTDVDGDLQRRFTRALVRGFRYAVDHPEEAGQIVHKAAPAVSAASATGELRLLKPYVDSPVANPDLVARSIALLQGIGMIPTPIKPEQVFDFAVANSGPGS